VKLVVDTNVLISGSAWAGTASRLVAELADALQRQKFRARFEWGQQKTAAILARFEQVAQMFDPTPMPLPAALRDPDDVHVLACAVAAAADAIVTSDNDLLSMKSFEAIPIVTVREALERLGLSVE
jgi:putative PIN family toxin of toxin-antitoxin system